MERFVTLSLLALRVKKFFQLTDPVSCGCLVVPRSVIPACALLLREACIQLQLDALCVPVSWHFLDLLDPSSTSIAL